MGQIPVFLGVMRFSENPLTLCLYHLMDFFLRCRFRCVHDHGTVSFNGDGQFAAP
jgi:hypothetical protein